MARKAIPFAVLGQLVGKPMPTCETVLALVRERARQAGCDPAAGAWSRRARVFKLG